MQPPFGTTVNLVLKIATAFKDKVEGVMTLRGAQFLDLWKLEQFEVQLGVKMNFYKLGFWSITITETRLPVVLWEPFSPHLDCKETVVFWL